MIRFVAAAAIAFLPAVASTSALAQGADCGDVLAVFDGRGTTFEDIKGAYLTDSEEWVPTISLPGAECRIDMEGDKGRYACTWSIKGGTERQARAQIVAMSVHSRDCLTKRGVDYDLWTPGNGRYVALLHERKLGVAIATSVFTTTRGFVAEWKMTTWKNDIDWDNIPDSEWNFPMNGDK